MTTTNTALRVTTMTGHAAAARIGVSQYHLMKLATLGRVRTVAEPGAHIQYVEEDVVKLAAEFGPPAVQDPGSPQ